MPRGGAFIQPVEPGNPIPPPALRRPAPFTQGRLWLSDSPCCVGVQGPLRASCRPLSLGCPWRFLSWTAPAARSLFAAKREWGAGKHPSWRGQKMRPFGRKEKPGPLCGKKRGSRPFGRRIKKAPRRGAFWRFSLFYSRAVRYSALYTATEGSLSSRISKNRRKVILLSPATRQRVSSGKKGSRIARAKSLSKRF